jgi:hypothetical protein
MLAAIYTLVDCLSALQETLLPYDGPIDDRIDYDETYANYLIASAMTVDASTKLVRLMHESLVD